MRFMVIVKASADSEAGALPTAEQLAAMGRYIDDLAGAGVLLAAEGLLSSARGARVQFADGGTTVTDGPFAETKELIAGFWLLQVRSRDEAIEWVRRCPQSGLGANCELEVRQVAEASDFPDEVFPPEAKAREEQQRQRSGLAEA